MLHKFTYYYTFMPILAPNSKVLGAKKISELFNIKTPK